MVDTGDWIPARASLGRNDKLEPMRVSFHHTHSFDEVQLRKLGTQVAVTLRLG